MLASIALLSCTSENNPLTVEKKHGASGASDYLIIYKNSAAIDFVTTRPDESDKSILLCIPGAFTRLSDYKIDGLFISDGVVGNRDKINYTLGEGMTIINGQCQIFPTNMGKLITDSLINEVVNKKGSFFQQVRMIDYKGLATFSEEATTWRRGIALFKDGKTAIIESTKPVSFGTFTTDLAALGATGLIYTDMGAWDEGWYRDPESGHLISMGTSHTQTAKQSNWVVFKK